MKSRRVCIRTRSPPASLPLKGLVTRHTTVKWPIEGEHIERTRLQYRSRGKKNHRGGLKQRNVTPKELEKHENVDKPERCVVRLYKKHISKCPKDSKKDEVFCLTPKKDVKLESNIWYTKIPFEKYILRAVVVVVKKQKLEGTKPTTP